MRRNRAALSLLLLALLLAGCGGAGTTEQEAPVVSRTNFQMDTVVTITLYDWSDESTIDQAFREIDRLEALLSVQKEGSDLDRLAKAAGRDWVDVSPETQEVLELAREFHTLSGGRFDVTAGPLIQLWDVNGGGHYPTEEELAEVLPLIGGEDLLVEEGRAFLRRPGMMADLGAVAKGYIADRVKDLLVDQGVEHAILDLGRNILLIGGKTEGTPFRIGVQDPNQEEGKILAVVEAEDMSVVTSGVYERYFLYEGKRYHHILDPFTGFPADNGLAGVSILSDESALGDALSTTCLLLGEEKGMELIESLDGVEALFVFEDGETRTSSGFDAYLAPS